MKRLSLREWMPIFPRPVWPLAGHAILGQNVVVGSMLVLRVSLGNVPRGVWLDPRLYHKDTSPRLAVELPRLWHIQSAWLFTRQAVWIFEDVADDCVCCLQ